MIEELIRALKDNTNLHTLSMTNVKFSEDHAIVSEDKEKGRVREREREREREAGRRQRAGGSERESLL